MNGKIRKFRKTNTFFAVFLVGTSLLGPLQISAEEKRPVELKQGQSVVSKLTLGEENDSGQTNQNKWIKEGNHWYYLDNYGNKQTGWIQISGSWYYLADNGVMQTGWTKVESTWYYMNPSGAMHTGWKQLGSRWYYMNPSGAMHTGWKKLGSKWYYMNTSGSMEIGWTKIGYSWYYLNQNGAMQTGWVKIHNNWYYMNRSGVMQKTGWRKVGREYYLFNQKGIWDKEGESGSAKPNDRLEDDAFSGTFYVPSDIPNGSKLIRIYNNGAAFRHNIMLPGGSEVTRVSVSESKEITISMSDESGELLLVYIYEDGSIKSGFKPLEISSDGLDALVNLDAQYRDAYGW